MGKNNKKRAAQRNQDHGHSKKKQRKQGGGYWINSCRESAPKEGALASIMTILISQSDSTDNHTHAAAAQDKSESETIETAKNAEEASKAESVRSEAKKNEASKGVADTTVDEATDGAKSLQGLKQHEDHSHAFISVKRLPSASGPPKVVRDICSNVLLLVVI